VKRRRSLKGVTQDDVSKTVSHILNVCPKRWKTKQYEPICRSVAAIFSEGIQKHGTSKGGILKAINEADSMCQTYNPQYRRVCEKMAAGIVRNLAARRPGLEGRRKR
jgi:hypothetical protein